jgi:hypothetical protein
MAQRFGGIKEQLLDLITHGIAERGFVVLLHDHRNLGGDTGTPRGDVNRGIGHQLAEWVVLGLVARTAMVVVHVSAPFSDVLSPVVPVVEVGGGGSPTWHSRGIPAGFRTSAGLWP